MEASKLKKILELHKFWADNETGGKFADLSGAELSGADLHDVDLRSANLKGANLTGANLKGANLSYTNLYGAKLENANFEGAFIERADLMRTNLTGASLIGANLMGATLIGANLREAILTGANFLNSYLIDAIGLPNISWIEPSCLIQLNRIYYGFYLEKESKWENFIQDGIGCFIQNNPKDKTFDLITDDRIIRNIPDWVKYSGMKKIT